MLNSFQSVAAYIFEFKISKNRKVIKPFVVDKFYIVEIDLCSHKL